MLNIFKLNSINYETEYKIQIAFCDKTQDFRNLNILGVLTRPYQAMAPDFQQEQVLPQSEELPGRVWTALSWSDSSPDKATERGQERWQTGPKIYMEMQGTLNTKQFWKRRTKLEDSHFLILKLPTKLQ